MKKVNFGVIGAGGIAQRKTIRGLLQAKNCRVLVTMNPSQANEIAAQFGLNRAYTREVDLLSDPGVEAVYIASPVYCHARQIQMSASAGKHILCEKPLTLNLREGRSAVAACRKHGVFDFAVSAAISGQAFHLFRAGSKIPQGALLGSPAFSR